MWHTSVFIQRVWWISFLQNMPYVFQALILYIVYLYYNDFLYQSRSTGNRALRDVDGVEVIEGNIIKGWVGIKDPDRRCGSTTGPAAEGDLYCFQTWRTRGEHSTPAWKECLQLRGELPSKGSVPRSRNTATPHLQPWEWELGESVPLPYSCVLPISCGASHCLHPTRSQSASVIDAV